MITKASIYYIFDPLCGYCNIARPHINWFLRRVPSTVETCLIHRRLFEGEITPAESKSFMIEAKLLGQNIFSEFGVKPANNRYFENLRRESYQLDSSMSALACAAIEMMNKELLLDYINLSQEMIFNVGRLPEAYGTYRDVAKDLGVSLSEFSLLVSSVKARKLSKSNAKLGSVLLGKTKRARIPVLLLQIDNLFYELDPYRGYTALNRFNTILSSARWRGDSVIKTDYECNSSSSLGCEIVKIS